METVKRSKRYTQRAKLVEAGKRYPLSEAVKTIKKVNNSKYDETLTLNFQLGIRLDSGTENVRGTVSLPHGSGKSIRVICFVKGEAAKEAKDAGADLVGAEELVQKISEGWFEFDAVVAHPDMMREVSKLGRVLGPRGLMPTPKTGTVTPNVAKAVKELKAGRIEFKSDKTGGLHAVCGKLSFSESALIENASSVIRAVQEAKPAAAKGDYIKSVTIALTQGPGLTLSLNALSN
jgi:large subunit ribosomal protein L1